MNIQLWPCMIMLEQSHQFSLLTLFSCKKAAPWPVIKRDMDRKWRLSTRVPNCCGVKIMASRWNSWISLYIYIYMEKKEPQFSLTDVGAPKLIYGVHETTSCGHVCPTEPCGTSLFLLLAVYWSMVESPWSSGPVGKPFHFRARSFDHHTPLGPSSLVVPSLLGTIGGLIASDQKGLICLDPPFVDYFRTINTRYFQWLMLWYNYLLHRHNSMGIGIVGPHWRSAPRDFQA